MASHTGWRWGWLRAGALGVLLGVLIAPSTARASCGDYVVLGASPLHFSGHPERVSANGRHESMPAVPGPRPCSGPGCNRGMPFPLPAPTSLSTFQAEDWLCLLDRLLPIDPQRSTILMDQSASLIPGHERSIFHPPRLHHS
jgi:hypothetical protein